MNTRWIKNVGNTLSKNSPTILTILATGGLVTTVFMAVKATPNALLLIDEALELKQEELRRTTDLEDFEPLLTKKEVVQLTWKCYIPTALMCGAPIACIIGANSINLRRNAALASVYSLTETALKEYQSKVVETIGKNKEQKIRDEIAADNIKKNPVKNSEVIITGKGDTLCYDALSGRYFKSNIEDIRQKINELNRSMLSEMSILLNDVYYELGLKETKVGNLLGWHVNDGLIEPAFSSQLTEDQTPCLVLDFKVAPKYDYNG